MAGPFSFFVEAHSHLNDTTLIRRRRETGLLLRVPDPSRFEGSGFVFLTTRNSSQGDQPSKGARAAHIQTQNCVKRARAAAERYRDLRRVAQVAGYLFHEEHSRAEYNIAGSARAVPRGFYKRRCQEKTLLPSAKGIFFLHRAPVHSCDCRSPERFLLIQDTRSKLSHSAFVPPALTPSQAAWCQPWFYLRLVAYSFVGLSEGAYGAP